MGFRIGNGYDAHRLASERRLILGGVEIPYPLGLLGHSDADVLVHAIIDSLLGAAGLGDIGKFFPDKDEKYSGANSLILLNEISVILSKKSFNIINIDSVIVAEKPNLSYYIEEMKSNIAVYAKILPRCVNIKATTEEGMGFTGSGIGISAYAVCLLSFPDNEVKDL